jgi:hypothetical protein
MKRCNGQLASVLWDARGFIFIDYLEKGQTINSEYYIALLERLNDEIEDGWQVDGVYMNFSKAFDRVLHGRLKFNLSIFLGGSLLYWMGSYLTGWTQRVKLENYLSESIQCHSGVSQGSHLGPIFFILDINDKRGIEHLRKCECVGIRLFSVYS